MNNAKCSFFPPLRPQTTFPCTIHCVWSEKRDNLKERKKERKKEIEKEREGRPVVDISAFVARESTLCCCQRFFLLSLNLAPKAKKGLKTHQRKHLGSVSLLSFSLLIQASSLIFKAETEEEAEDPP